MDSLQNAKNEVKEVLEAFESGKDETLGPTMDSRDIEAEAAELTAAFGDFHERLAQAGEQCILRLPALDVDIRIDGGELVLTMRIGEYR